VIPPDAPRTRGSVELAQVGRGSSWRSSFSSMAVDLITADDEHDCCCVLRCGERRRQATALRFAAEGADEHEQEHELYGTAAATARRNSSRYSDRTTS
jgi:hypothetical protein